MINDEQRREVAKRLRERTKHKLAKGESMQHMFSETLGVYRTYDYESFGLVKESETWKNIVNLLADLIEPEERTCHVIDRGPFGACSACGADVFADPGGNEGSYCSNCSARVVRGDE